MPNASGIAKVSAVPSWTVVTEAPLLGLSLARESGMLLAWDDAGHFYLIDAEGERVAESRVQEPIRSAAISDDGTLVALLLGRSKLMMLGSDFDLLVDRASPGDAATLAIDPHGRFVAVATKGNETTIFNKFGRVACTFETRQPLVHLKFIPSRPILVGAATYGLLVGVEFNEIRLTGGLDAEILWEEKISTNVGRLATSGDGGLILASCFTHGVQRYDVQGRNDGSYHVGGTATHAVPDFVGRSIAVATTEGELSLLNAAGNVRWKTGLSRPAVALEVDALGRYLYYGLGTGEIGRIDFDSSCASPAKAPSAKKATKARPGSVHEPEWSKALSQSDDQAETTVLAVLDDPPRVGVFSNTSKLQVFTTEGEALGQAPDCHGVGRILRTAPGWIAAATDRTLVLYDARQNGAMRLDLSLVALTHLALRPETFGLAIVQERDRIGRATTAGRWVWRQELRTPVEDLALGDGNLVAVTTDSGSLIVFDAAGERAGSYTANPVEPLALVETPLEAPPGLTWVTLARRAQVLRGHGLDGRVLWESPVPWEAWQLHRIGPRLVVSSPDGRVLSYDGTGHLRSQGRSDSTFGEFLPGPDGDTLRVVKQGVHLICADLSGKVKWRAVSEASIGPFAAARPGVAAMFGRSLVWFGAGK